MKNIKSIPFINLEAQQEKIRTLLDNRIAEVLKHGQYIMGPEVKELEKKLANYVGVKHCVTVASGTDALLIALMAIGVSVGDEVITTPFTFIASAEVIALLGAKPVFVDIDNKTYNLDPKMLESAITLKTKAIIPVSLYGQCADLDSINVIAEKYDIPVIEDGAQSFGATYKGRRSCSLSTIGCTSFFPSKPLGAYGDGGACFTDDDELVEKMTWIRVHGQDRRYHHSLLGTTGRMDTLQAAILLTKFEIFDIEVDSRNKIGQRYTELLKENAEIITPYIEPYNSSVYAQYTVQVNKREEIQSKLSNVGIPTAIHYPIPLHLQTVFSKLNKGKGSFTVAEEIANRVISLPMHPYLDEDTQDTIVQKVLGFLKRE